MGFYEIRHKEEVVLTSNQKDVSIPTVLTKLLGALALETKV